MTDCIIVLDFGGQYCHLIARRIRELNVYSEIVSPEITAEAIEDYRDCRVRGIIISGGPQSVYSERIKFDKNILNLDLGILGLCYGHQLIAYSTGGGVETAGKKEFGITTAIIDKPEGILKGLNRTERVWMSHSDTVTRIPDDYEILAHTQNSPIAAYRHKTKHIYGLQWHPEVVHTENGMRIFRNFVLEICGAKPNWRMDNFVENSVSEIRERVGDRTAVIALSGGVDSSVAAILTARAIGKNLVSVFVDTGLMRKNEPEQIEKMFRNLHLNLRVIDARSRFFKSLKGVKDPEKKRKIIGENFIRVFEEAAKDIDAKVLVQGTIYPDRIESGTRYASTIKSHHNVGGLPDKLKLEILEPLAELYKDEVRVVAKDLGLPKDITERMPFPGPALAIRVIGEITPERINIVRRADAVVNEEIRRAKADMNIWQSFAVLLPLKSVGVQGDTRTYKNTIAIRIVESRDGMTANFARIPYDILERISTRITNEIPAVNRVVYDLTHKPPATIEWE